MERSWELYTLAPPVVDQRQYRPNTPIRNAPVVGIMLRLAAEFANASHVMQALRPILKRIGQHLGQVARAPASAVGYLVAAAGAHRHDLGLGRERTDGREQYTLADLQRDIIVLGLIAERAGHA